MTQELKSDRIKVEFGCPVPYGVLRAESLELSIFNV
jgi:hypothetical protein